MDRTGSDDRVFDEAQWRREALAVIKDIECGVLDAKVAERPHSTNKCVYLNIATLEGDRYCVELTASGFRIAAKSFDSTSGGDLTFYETPYALLDTVSPAFRERFGKSLISKLNDLQ